MASRANPPPPPAQCVTDRAWHGDEVIYEKHPTSACSRLLAAARGSSLLSVQSTPNEGSTLCQSVSCYVLSMQMHVTLSVDHLHCWKRVWLGRRKGPVSQCFWQRAVINGQHCELLDVFVIPTQLWSRGELLGSFYTKWNDVRNLADRYLGSISYSHRLLLNVMMASTYQQIRL